MQTVYGPQAYNPPLGGYTQAYANVTSSRALGTTYTNNTGRPLVVSVICLIESAGGYFNFYVEGVNICSGPPSPSAFTTGGAFFIVPVGQTYEVGGVNSTVDLVNWFEY